MFVWLRILFRPGAALGLMAATWFGAAAAPMVVIAPASPAPAVFPAATAMADGAPAPTPPGWTGYCARTAQDPACSH